jgi:hypothetical protein
MSQAIKLIVDGYVALKDRVAIEEIRAHRQRLRRQLEERPRGGIDASPTMEVFDEELRVIETALASFSER